MKVTSKTGPVAQPNDELFEDNFDMRHKDFGDWILRDLAYTDTQCANIKARIRQEQRHLKDMTNRKKFLVKKMSQFLALKKSLTNSGVIR